MVVELVLKMVAFRRVLRAPGKRHGWVVLCLILSAGTAQAQDSGLSFLRIGTSAAAIALGDGYVALSRDAFSTYWNPAGLAVPGTNMLALSHHIWVSDVRTYAVSTRFGVGQTGGLGFFVTATGSGDLEARERPGPSEGTFDAQFVSAGAAYGRRFGPFRVGLTLKYLSERIFTSSATGYGLDVGAQLDLFGDRIQLGAALQNLGEMGKLNAEATKLPRTLRLGGALFPFRILNADDGTTLLSAFVTTEVSRNIPDETTRVHLGFAAEVLETIIARVGYITNDELRDLTFGAGLLYGGFRFDYALLPFSEGFGGTGHVLTLNYGW